MPADTPADRLRGLLLMMAAVLCFALLDSTAKWLAQGYAISQIVWARYLGGLIFAVLYSWPKHGWQVVKTRRPGLQALRGALLLSCTGCNFLALSYLPLAENASILFTTPLFVCALSIPLLGEQVGWRRTLAICVGFFGVLVIIRPGFGALHWAAGVSLAGAFLGALYNITTRKAAGSDSANTSLFYVGLVGTLLSLPFAFQDWRDPAGLDLALFCFMGLVGGFGHYLLTVAHGLAPASMLAPFIYTQIVWTTLLGYLIFAQLPDLWIFVGAAIVIGSGLYLIYRERQLGRGVTAATRTGA